MSEARRRAYAINGEIWYSVVSSKVDQLHLFTCAQVENEKTTAETEAESIVSITIQQDTSAIPPMTTPLIDLTSRPDSPNVHRPLQATATETTTMTTTITTTTTTTHPPPPQPQQRTTDSMLIKCIDLEKSTNRDHTDELLKDMAEARKKKKKRHDSPKTPPGSPPPPLPPVAPSSSKTAASAKYTAWMTTDTRLRPCVSSIPKDLHMDDDMAPDEHVHSSDDEDIRIAHIPKVIIQSDFFINKDLEYLRYSSKDGRLALSILKMKAAYYPNIGLEKMVPDQMWIEEECKHTSEGDRGAVRTRMQILSVVRIEVFSMYGQRVKDFQLGIESYQTQLNLTKPQWDATGFKYKHDFMVIDSPRAVTFRNKYGVQMIMQFNKIHKFSDGTQHQIDEPLDYRVKEFKVNRMNPSLNTRF
nr:hypothetical protein [Tanacetum cinerariifolium]